MLISPRDIKTSVTVSNSLIPEYKLPDDHVQCGFIVDAWSLNEMSKCPILFCLSVLSWTCESRHDPLPPPFIQRLHHSRSKLRKVIVCHLPSACWFFLQGVLRDQRDLELFDDQFKDAYTPKKVGYFDDDDDESY